MLIAVAVAAIIAVAFVSVVSGSYSLKGGAYRYDVESNATRELTRDEETFLRQHVTRTVHSQPSSGGSGSGGGRGSAVHRSSSGGTHGGGSGRKF